VTVAAVCPRCAGASVDLSGGSQCAECGLASNASGRLWLAPSEALPCGFDRAAAERLEALGEQNHFWMRERRRLAGRLLGRLASAAARPWRDALELGCGTGPMLPLLEAQAERVVAIDAHRGLLERAHAGCDRTTLVQGEVTDTGLAAARFDLVAAFDVIEHVEPDAFLREARRVARDGAHLLISAPASPALWSAMDVRAGHRCRYRWPGLKAELERNGWRPLGHTHFQFLLYPLVFASRRLGGGSPRGPERRPPRAVDRLLGAINRAEVRLFGGWTLPVGSSLFAWARAEECAEE
jgi:SAM-dependent methyltransferase